MISLHQTLRELFTPTAPCAEWDGRLNDYVDETCSDEVRLAVEAHLAGCQVCQEYDRQLRTLSAILEMLPAEVEPPHGFRAAVVERASAMRGVRELEPAWTQEPTDEIISTLSEAISARQSQFAHRLMAPYIPGLPSSSMRSPRVAARLIGCFARWLDLGPSHIGVSRGFSNLDALKLALARFPKASRAEIPVVDLMHIKIAEGLAAYYSEEYEQAIANFALVLTLEGELTDKELPGLAALNISRCYKQRGGYDEALKSNQQADRLAREACRDELLAVVTVNESWLRFQKGQLEEARRALKEAERLLQGSEDHVSLGHLHWCKGRMAELEGDNAPALDSYEEARRHYKTCDAHAELSRVLVRMAFIKLQMAIHRGEEGGQEESYKIKLGFVSEDQNSVLVSQAKKLLARARHIYKCQNHCRGQGDVYRTRALIHIATGRLREAESEAARAFDLGEGNEDCLLMARARIVQCMIENLKIEGHTLSKSRVAYHAELANSFATNAITYAARTEHIRLQAHAEIWLGLTYLNDFFRKPVKASNCYCRADKMLRPKGRHSVYHHLQLQQPHKVARASAARKGDHVYHDLQFLKRQLERAGVTMGDDEGDDRGGTSISLDAVHGHDAADAIEEVSHDV